MSDEMNFVDGFDKIVKYIIAFCQDTDIQESLTFIKIPADDNMTIRYTRSYRQLPDGSNGGSFPLADDKQNVLKQAMSLNDQRRSKSKERLNDEEVVNSIYHIVRYTNDE